MPNRPTCLSKSAVLVKKRAGRTFWLKPLLHGTFITQAQPLLQGKSHHSPAILRLISRIREPLVKNCACVHLGRTAVLYRAKFISRVPSLQMKFLFQPFFWDRFDGRLFSRVQKLLLSHLSGGGGGIDDGWRLRVRRMVIYFHNLREPLNGILPRSMLKIVLFHIVLMGFVGIYLPFLICAPLFWIEVVDHGLVSWTRTRDLQPSSEPAQKSQNSGVDSDPLWTVTTTCVCGMTEQCHCAGPFKPRLS